MKSWCDQKELNVFQFTVFWRKVHQLPKVRRFKGGVFATKWGPQFLAKFSRHPLENPSRYMYMFSYLQPFFALNLAKENKVHSHYFMAHVSRQNLCATKLVNRWWNVRRLKYRTLTRQETLEACSITYLSVLLFNDLYHPKVVNLRGSQNIENLDFSCLVVSKMGSRKYLFIDVVLTKSSWTWA